MGGFRVIRPSDRLPDAVSGAIPNVCAAFSALDAVGESQTFHSVHVGGTEPLSSPRLGI